MTMKLTPQEVSMLDEIKDAEQKDLAIAQGSTRSADVTMHYAQLRMSAWGEIRLAHHVADVVAFMLGVGPYAGSKDQGSSEGVKEEPVPGSSGAVGSKPADPNDGDDDIVLGTRAY